MNCGQCGAPIKVVEGQVVFKCDYCGCYNFMDAGLDGVVLIDAPSSYQCPECGKQLYEALVRKVRIHSCPNCHGNLIEQSKMLAVLSQAGYLVRPGGETQVYRDLAELNRTLACPSCRHTMEAYPYGGARDLIIQGCARCGLVWLDFGELSRILRSYVETDNRSRARQTPKRPLNP